MTLSSPFKMHTRKRRHGSSGQSSADGAPEFRRKGQATVEAMLVVLCFFIPLTFTIMDVCHLCFMAILVKHVAYETARHVSLTAGAGTVCGQDPNLSNGDYTTWASQILTVDKAVAVKQDDGVYDPQAHCTPHDVEVTVAKNVPFLFKGFSAPILFVPYIAISKSCPDSATAEGCTRQDSSCCITAKVRMPIEQPLEASYSN